MSSRCAPLQSTGVLIAVIALIVAAAVALRGNLPGLLHTTATKV